MDRVARHAWHSRVRRNTFDPIVCTTTTGGPVRRLHGRHRGQACANVGGGTREAPRARCAAPASAERGYMNDLVYAPPPTPPPPSPPPPSPPQLFPLDECEGMNVERDVDFTSTGGDPLTLGNHLESCQTNPDCLIPTGATHGYFVHLASTTSRAPTTAANATKTRSPARGSSSTFPTTCYFKGGIWGVDLSTDGSAEHIDHIVYYKPRRQCASEAAANAAAAKPTASATAAQPSAEHARLLSHLFRALLAGRRAGLEWCRRHRAVGRRVGIVVASSIGDPVECCEACFGIRPPSAAAALPAILARRRRRPRSCWQRTRASALPKTASSEGIPDLSVSSTGPCSGAPRQLRCTARRRAPRPAPRSATACPLPQWRRVSALSSQTTLAHATAETATHLWWARAGMARAQR